MKTAISIPDPLFHAAEVLAHRQKKSRSELYADAVREYIQSHKNKDVTQALNAIYGHELSRVDETLLGMQSQTVKRDEW